MTLFLDMFLLRSLLFCCFLFFFFSSRRRHTRSVSAFLLNRSSDLVRYTQDAFSRSGWLWPVDAKGEPLKATSYMAVGFYVALLILALLQRIFLMSSLMLLLVWLIFFMVLIKLLPIDRKSVV